MFTAYFCNVRCFQWADQSRLEYEIIKRRLLFVKKLQHKLKPINRFKYFNEFQPAYLATPATLKNVSYFQFLE